MDGADGQIHPVRNQSVAEIQVTTATADFTDAEVVALIRRLIIG